MHFGLTEEQEMIVDTVRSFVENEIYPLEAEIERLGHVPKEIADDLKAKVLGMGFYAPNFPEEVGGGGLNHLEFALLERELGRGSMALTHFWGRPQNILMACEGEQREKYLLPAVRGERMDALAMTEPDAGSDVRGMKTTARRDGDDWILNGTKHFISGAAHADFVIVFVATGEDMTDKGPKKRITCFLVDRGHPGFEISPGYHSVSHRGYDNMVLSFDDCRIPNSQVLGEVDGGFDVMNTWLYATRITVATMCVGRARRVLDIATQYCVDRKQFGQQIGKFQGVSFKLADMVTEISLGLQGCLRLGRMKDEGSASLELTSIMKRNSCGKALEIARVARDMMGGNGISDEYGVARHLVNLEVVNTYEGTHDIHALIIGRSLTGLAAF